MMITKLGIVMFGIGAVATTVIGQEIKVPAEVAPFIEAGAKAIAVESADLNGDGRKDYVLVLHRDGVAKDTEDFPVDQRPLLVLIRGADGRLSIAKRNNKIVMCDQCGGVFGDPFEGIRVRRNSFTVDHYGGSNWRWKYEYQFNYSRIDQTWQLVRVKDVSYHTSNPNKMTTMYFTPPRDYGKINVEAFDPENYLNEKAKRRAEQ
jgi:hypothetical protein